MKAKVLLPLIGLCVALGIIVMTKRTTEPQISLVEQVELTPLLDASVDTSQVTVLEIFAGVSPHQRLSMVHENDEWRMTSYHNALVSPQRPLKILEAVKEFKGEFRAEATEEQLADYNLSIDRAFHIRGIIGETGDVSFHLLAGKSPKPGNIFMRRSDSNTIYLVNHNIRQGAFMKTADFDEIPSPYRWLDLNIIAEPNATLTKVELTMPDKKLSFEKRTSESGDTAAPTSEWVITEGGLTLPIKPKALDTLEYTLKSLDAFQVISPDTNELSGLDNLHTRYARIAKTGTPSNWSCHNPPPATLAM